MSTNGTNGYSPITQTSFANINGTSQHPIPHDNDIKSQQIAFETIKSQPEIKGLDFKEMPLQQITKNNDEEIFLWEDDENTVSEIQKLPLVNVSYSKFTEKIEAKIIDQIEKSFDTIDVRDNEHSIVTINKGTNTQGQRMKILLDSQVHNN